MTEENPGTNNDGSGLRAQLEAALAELNTLRSAQRSNDIKAALSANGLPEGVASLIPADANVTEWVEQNKSLFAAAAPAPAAETAAPAEGSPAQQPAPVVQAQQAGQPAESRIDTLAAGATSTAPGGDFAARLASAKGEEIDAVIAEMIAAGVPL